MKCVGSVGELGMRDEIGRGMHGVLVERVLVQVGVCLGIGGDDNAVDGRDLGRGFCTALGRL